jgi:hypothetical protein
MKKILLGATALSVMGLAGAASAQEWSVRVGGFMTTGIGYVDTEAHEAEVEIVNNSEVTFNFRLVADNGLTFGAKAELENNGASNNMDEYVGWVEGSFGRVEIGAEDGAHDRLVGAAAGATAFTSAADETGLLFDYAGAESGVVVVTQGYESSDDLKITYFTPRIAGFQAGVSYANAPEGGTSTDGSNGGRESFEIGANYNNTFGDVSLFVGGGYTSFSDPYNPRFAGRIPDQAYTVVANVGYAGFTVGGIWGVSEFDNASDQEGFGVGAGYATGPWNFGVQYAWGDGQEGLTGDDEINAVSVGVDYALAPGVTVGAVGEWGDNDTANEDAWATGVFMNFDF